MSPQSLDRSTVIPHPFIIEELSPTSPEGRIAVARDLLLEYGWFVQQHSEITSFCFGSLEIEASRLPFSYIEQGGGCLIASQPGLSLGFVAWRTLPSTGNSELKMVKDAWEIKRLWVRPAARGTGLGRTLIEAIVKRALHAGKTRLVLDTAPQAMPAAHRLYLDLGFRECPSYTGNHFDGILFMSRELP